MSAECRKDFRILRGFLQSSSLDDWSRPITSSFPGPDCPRQFTVGSESLSLPSSTALFGLGRLTPPTMPTAFPLHVPLVTFSPNFVSLSIAADNFFDDLPSFFGIFTPSLYSSARLSPRKPLLCGI